MGRPRGEADAAGPGPSLRLLEDALDLEVDGDLLADGHAAARDRPVVADPEVVPVDLAGGGEPGPRAAVGVGAEAVHLQLQRHWPGNAAQAEVAVEEEAVTVLADARGLERHDGMLLDVEEVRTADVVVA